MRQFPKSTYSGHPTLSAPTLALLRRLQSHAIGLHFLACSGLIPRYKEMAVSKTLSPKSPQNEPLFIRLPSFKLIGLLFLSQLLSACEPGGPAYNTRFMAFGTLINLSIVGAGREQAINAAESLERDFAIMHRAWHAWDPGPVGYVNRSISQGEQAFAAPPSVIPLIRLGKKFEQQSGGLFNPAIGRLIDIWGFHTDSPECLPPPPRKAIETLLKQQPSMSDLSLDGMILRTENRSIQLDFGAFGKGYGIDLAIAHLRELGIRNAIVNAGGDLRAIGNRGGRPWRIAIRSPSGGVMAVLEVSGDESVFSSGDYERNFVYEGETYHHIIDPRTGFPAKGSRSVTVIHDNAVTADAAATALFVAGPGDWPKVAKSMGIKYVLLMDQAGTMHMTPAMAQRIKFVDQDPDIKLSPPI